MYKSERQVTMKNFSKRFIATVLLVLTVAISTTTAFGASITFKENPKKETISFKIGKDELKIKKAYLDDLKRTSKGFKGHVGIGTLYIEFTASNKEIDFDVVPTDPRVVPGRGYLSIGAPIGHSKFKCHGWTEPYYEEHWVRRNHRWVHVVIVNIYGGQKLMFSHVKKHVWEVEELYYPYNYKKK